MIKFGAKSRFIAKLQCKATFDEVGKEYSRDYNYNYVFNSTKSLFRNDYEKAVANLMNKYLDFNGEGFFHPGCLVYRRTQLPTTLEDKYVGNYIYIKQDQQNALYFIINDSGNVHAKKEKKDGDLDYLFLGNEKEVYLEFANLKTHILDKISGVTQGPSLTNKTLQKFKTELHNINKQYFTSNKVSDKKPTTTEEYRRMFIDTHVALRKATWKPTYSTVDYNTWSLEAILKHADNHKDSRSREVCELLGWISNGRVHCKGSDYKKRCPFQHAYVLGINYSEKEYALVPKDEDISDEPCFTDDGTKSHPFVRTTT